MSDVIRVKLAGVKYTQKPAFFFGAAQAKAGISAGIGWGSCFVLGADVTFQAFLRDLQGPLLNVGVGVGLYFLAEYWPRYNTLEPRLKRLVIFLMCLIIPCGAAGLAVFLGYQPNSIELTWWPAAVAGATAFATATGMHGARNLGRQTLPY